MESSMRLYALLCAALLPVMMCLSCNKLISDLIPPDEQKLISLDLRNVERYVCSTNTAIRDHSVTVTVPNGSACADRSGNRFAARYFDTAYRALPCAAFAELRDGSVKRIIRLHYRAE